MILEFTIYGNHADQDGNPIPKAKLTLGQQWTEKAQAYAAWKRHIQWTFKEVCVMRMIGPKEKPAVIPTGKTKPLDIAGKKSARMDLKIFWANEKHGDPENIFGSIADALFENDKHLDGSFEAKHDPKGKGRVEVKVTIV